MAIVDYIGLVGPSGPLGPSGSTGSVGPTGVTGPSGAGTVTSTLASRPAAGVTGRLHLPTDGYYPAEDSGSVWAPQPLLGPSFQTSNPPAVGTFTKLTAGSDGTTLATDGDGLLFTQMGNASTGTYSCIYSAGALPSAPYNWVVGFDITQVAWLNYRQMGLALMAGNSTSSYYVTFFMSANTSASKLVFGAAKWTAINTYSAAYTISYDVFPPGVSTLFLKINDTNTNRVYYVSVDGRNWQLVFSVGRTDFCTPTYYGLYSQPSNTSLPTTVTGFQSKIFHWSIG
jgi:hypothetical protein